MVDKHQCRICMARENLTSIFSIMDGGKISDKIHFVCGLSVSRFIQFDELNSKFFCIVLDFVIGLFAEIHLSSMPVKYHYRKQH